MTRPAWKEYGLGVAQTVAARGDCTRRQVGAVILGSDHRIVGAGYNGSYPGGPSCLAGDCPRGQHYRFVCDECLAYESGACYEWPEAHICNCGADWPCPEAVEPGSSYDTGPGACIAVHAEINALLDVSDRRRLTGATLYLTHEPCEGCLKIVRNSGVKQVLWPEDSIYW